MPAIQLDFTGVQDSGFEPFPAGEPIEFTLFAINDKKSQKGDPMLEFEFKAVENNRRAWRNFVLLPQALWALKKALVEMGVPKEDLQGTFKLDPKKLLGTHVMLTFSEPSDYNGRQVQNIDRIALPSDESLPWVGE
jgi:hypothetical protein